MAWDHTKRANPVYASREYRAAKAAATKAFRQGDSCWHCGRPMHTSKPSSLHLEHSGTPATRDFMALGLSHAHCNLRDGSRKGRARQDKPTTRQTSLRW